MANKNSSNGNASENTMWGGRFASGPDAIDRFIRDELGHRGADA